ncbi:MAG TPA: hypothetical protein VGJ20_25405 [Xanthobacteraceae bacterium]|jgi:hypothetical protein
MNIKRKIEHKTFNPAFTETATAVTAIAELIEKYQEQALNELNTVKEDILRRVIDDLKRLQEDLGGDDAGE